MTSAYSLAAFREGSCAAAGARLGVNQSTISRRIAALENDLGVRLFDRMPEGLVPTASAEEIVPRAELFEATAAELMDAVEGLDTRLGGVVRVALPDLIASELVAPALPAFLRERPGLRVELIAGDAILDLTPPGGGSCASFCPAGERRFGRSACRDSALWSLRVEGVSSTSTAPSRQKSLRGSTGTRRKRTCPTRLGCTPPFQESSPCCAPPAWG